MKNETSPALDCRANINLDPDLCAFSRIDSSVHPSIHLGKPPSIFPSMQASFHTFMLLPFLLFFCRSLVCFSRCLCFYYCCPVLFLFLLCVSSCFFSLTCKYSTFLSCFMLFLFFSFHVFIVLSVLFCNFLFCSFLSFLPPLDPLRSQLTHPRFFHLHHFHTSVWGLGNGRRCVLGVTAFTVSSKGGRAPKEDSWQLPGGVQWDFSPVMVSFYKWQ